MHLPAPTGIYLALALVALAAVAYEDLRRRRIPNALVLVLLGGGLAHAAMAGGMRGVGLALTGVAVGLALLGLQYRLGWMGAGDVKLLAALGAWTGPLDVIYLLLGASVLGGVLALASLLRLGREERARVGHNLLGAVLTHELGAPSRASRRAGIPYGVAIAAAGAILLCRRGLG